MRTGKVTRDGFTSFLLSCCFEEVGGAAGCYGRDAIVGHQTENLYLQKSESILSLVRYLAYTDIVS